MTRLAGGLILLAILLAPQAGAADQDALLSRYAGYGTDALFEEYPALVYLKLAISNRLQTGQLAQAELVHLEFVLELLNDLEALHASLPNATVVDLSDAFPSLSRLRVMIDGLTDPAVAQYRRLLNITATSLTGAYVVAAERLLPTIARTTERLELLSAAVEAANAVQDGLAYSRLSLLEQDTRSAYEEDIAVAQARTARAREMLGIIPYAFSIDYPRYYAALFATRDDLTGAAALYTAHGEEDNAREATILQQDVSRRIGDHAQIISVVLVAYVAAIFALGLLLFRRLLLWSQHRTRAGLGDELVVEG